VREHELVDIPFEQLMRDGQLDVLPEIARGDYFSIVRKGSSLQLQARGFIGLIPLNERVAIDVAPRVPIRNLAHVLHVGGFAPRALADATRAYDREDEEMPSLRDVFAEALLDALHPIEALGALRDYRQQTERTTSPRGRVLLAARETQLAAIGASAHVRATWFERTADNAPNRCLKLVLRMLAAEYARRGRDRRRLLRRINTVYGLFHSAKLDTRLSFLSDPVVVGSRPLPALRDYYRPALDIALMILSRSSVAMDRAGSSVTLPSMVVNLDDVFERYVRAALGREVAQLSSRLVVEDGNAEGKKPLFDVLPSRQATPDIVVRARATGETPLVLDVKYKPAKSGPDRGDLEQVIAYAVSYRAPRVVVVQPKAHGAGRVGLHCLGAMGRLETFQYVIDLESTDLPREAAAFAQVVCELAESAGVPLNLNV
jgi:5-methylcytosine-specific restriction enzyme subunit McrC